MLAICSILTDCGEFKKWCAWGVYLPDMWLEWLETFDDVKNQLISYPLELKQLTVQISLVWSCSGWNSYYYSIYEYAAYIVCYIYLYIYQTVTAKLLLTNFTALYFHLKSYHKRLCKLDTRSIPAIKPFFANSLKKRHISVLCCYFRISASLCRRNWYLFDESISYQSF